MNILNTARLLKPTLSDLGPEFNVQEQKAENRHLAIEALRDLPTEESGRTTRHNLVPQRAF